MPDRHLLSPDERHRFVAACHDAQLDPLRFEIFLSLRSEREPALRRKITIKLGATLREYGAAAGHDCVRAFHEELRGQRFASWKPHERK